MGIASCGYTDHGRIGSVVNGFDLKSYLFCIVGVFGRESFLVACTWCG